MAFLKFTRDKRGYEHFYLVGAPDRRSQKSRPRILYWFRTPPNVKVGREPFEPAVRKALEAQNPDVTFDWQAILNTPIPAAEAVQWRERRQAARAARQAAEPDQPEAPETPSSTDAGEGIEDTDKMEAPDVRSTDLAGESAEGQGPGAPEGSERLAVQTSDGSTGPAGPQPPGGRRRRRRRRRGGRPQTGERGV